MLENIHLSLSITYFVVSLCMLIEFRTHGVKLLVMTKIQMALVIPSQERTQCLSTSDFLFQCSNHSITWVGQREPFKRKTNYDKNRPASDDIYTVPNT